MGLEKVHFHSNPKERKESESEVTLLCLTFWDLTDCSLPGFYIHGIFQARILEWGAIAFSAWGMRVVSFRKRVNLCLLCCCESLTPVWPRDRRIMSVVPGIFAGVGPVGEWLPVLLYQIWSHKYILSGAGSFCAFVPLDFKLPFPPCYRGQLICGHFLWRRDWRCSDGKKSHSDYSGEFSCLCTSVEDR